MKKNTILGAALVAAGAAAWYVAAGSRRGQVERLRRDELEALRDAAQAGELPHDALGPVPLDGAELDAVRVEKGTAVLILRGGRAAAWLSSGPLEELDGVRCRPWRGSARPGVLYTEALGDGWYAGYACLGWN